MISVIIPAYNSEKTIRKCIGLVLQNDYEEFEVIVVDDSSTDSTKEIIRSFNDPRLRTVTNKTDSGASFSRNQGIKKSKGNPIILLDADSYVTRDWIRGHAELYKETSADIFGGGIVGIYHSIYGRADGFCSWWNSIPHSKDRYLKKLHLPTNNLSIKKEVFQKIGYFNEKMRLGGEDAEFCFRALKNNLKI